MQSLNQKSPRKPSPKVLTVIIAAALLVLLSGFILFRPAFTGNVLDTVGAGDFRFDLCGSGGLSRIIVYKDGKKTATVRTSSVGAASDHYGVTVTDLNFDGAPDLLVAQTQKGDDRCYAVWTWNAATGTYRSADAVAEAPNVTVDETYECLVSHATETRYVGEDAYGTVYYEEAEIYRIFRSFKGEIVEFARYELVYYTKNDIHAFLISRFDETENKLSPFSEDHWLSASEAEGFDLRSEMYGDMEEHRSAYFPEETTAGTPAA